MTTDPSGPDTRFSPDTSADHAAADHRDQLYRALVRHVPGDVAEHRSRAQTLRYLESLAAPFDQTADPTHVTASAIVSDAAGRVVLHRHKRLGMWLQPGGHIEAGESPVAAAVRETREETGLVAQHPDDGPRLLHVDVHPGPHGHLHLDVRYLLLAEPGAGFEPGPGESVDVAWLPVAEAVGRSDASLAAALAALQRC